MTSHGSLRHQFQRALERGSVLDATSAAKAMGGLSLGDALALCVVLAERSPGQYQPAADRWISRFVEEMRGCRFRRCKVVAAALAALAAVPDLTRPVLREVLRFRRLSTVESVFSDFVRV